MAVGAGGGGVGDEALDLDVDGLCKAMQGFHRLPSKIPGLGVSIGARRGVGKLAMLVHVVRDVCEGGDTGARKLAAIKENANYFREAGQGPILKVPRLRVPLQELARRGFKVLGDVDSPIIPVMLHHPWKMAAFSRRCLDRGIAVVVVGNPAVPILYERVRFCISAAHSIPQLAEAITEITAVGRELGVLFELATSKQELEARAVQDQQYASWLRTAPLTKKVDATPAASWRPEALSPAAPAEDSLLASLQEACARPEEVVPGSQEFRLMDPLGYAASPLEAAFQATEATMDHYGFGACGPRGFYGGSLPHLELETVIAKHLGCESAIVYSAGVTTVSSVIPALVQTGDKVIVDSEVHLGFRAGLRLCKADVTWVPHNDLFSIERALAAKSTRSLEKGAGLLGRGASLFRYCIAPVASLCLIP